MKKILLTTAVLAAFGFSAGASAQVTVTTGGGYVKMVEALADKYEAETGATSLKKFTTVLNADAGVRLGDTPLILAWRKGLELKAPSDLAKPDVKRIAMPDPKAAVYGRAAKEFLDGAAFGKDVAPKMNVISMVPQVLSYVSQGEMDAGFINLLAARQGKAKLGGFMAVKEGYEPIRMTAQPVKGAEGEAADVKAFLKWLASPKADAILDKFGVVR